ncbi:hypothetical protein ACTZWW_04175 [Salinarimonas sp. NSM]|uniref:hypothetical protein n=1 Tax=Salinarimonas sp. NSM TaxID=3458003 RepID=UPI00403613FB
MTRDYTPQARTAARLVGANGAPVTIRRAGAPTGDPWNPTPGTPITAPAKTVMLEFSLRERDGTNILEGDRKALLTLDNATLTGGLAVGDMIVVSASEEWRVVDPRPLQPAPGGVVVLYEAQVRR